MRDHRFSRPLIAAASTAGLASVSWVLAIRQMDEMDMGPATEFGGFGAFAGLWVSMTAAMMLPGVIPALVAYTRDCLRVVPPFLASYLAVWMIVGIAVYPVYRPHGSLAAGAVVIAAGLYELTPLKQWFRRRGRDSARSGTEFGWCCVGSSVGLMAMLLALGVMSLTWMSVVAGLVLAQKVLPPRTALDVALGLGVVALGVAIVVAPAAVPGLVRPV